MASSVQVRPASPAVVSRPAAGRRILIAGGGHIGCHLLPLVARTGLVSRIRLVDRGRVGSAHVQSEGYPAEAVGRFKSDALRDRWAPLFPAVAIESIPADLEDVPVGDFDVAVCLGGLDSLRARQVLVSERAFPLGVPVVDGGVGDALLGRVQVLHPGSACLECRFGSNEYRTLATEYPCQPDGMYLAPSTIAPAFVGAAVAAIMTAEMVGILTGHQIAESSEIFFDLATRRFLTTRLRRAKKCRFDHQTVSNCLFLSVPFDRATLGDVLRALRDCYGSAALHLEFRRGVIQNGDAFGAHRLVTPPGLEHHQSRRLADLGLTARDRIRVYACGERPNAYIMLDQPQNSARTAT